MRYLFPIIANKIFKPKVPYSGHMEFIGQETDAYGYTFSRWRLEPVLKFRHEGQELTAQEGITYEWRPR